LPVYLVSAPNIDHRRSDGNNKSDLRYHFICFICYRERLLATAIGSLELPRLRHDLIFTYKSISNKLYTDKDGNMMTSSFPALIQIEVDNLFSFNAYSNTRGHVCFLRAGLSISGIPCLIRSALVLRQASANPLKTLICRHICGVNRPSLLS